ncbi:MAG TPA: hypothetical protein VHA80_03395 [Solirubrobacterales bacterium]|nr:hypothetical protein [Solirubrobacterales bacterium]
MPRTEEMPMTQQTGRDDPAPRSVAERFEGREPKLDVVPLSAPWRPFASREDRRHGKSIPR